MDRNLYGSPIPSESEFIKERDERRAAMGDDQALRDEAIELQMRAEKYGFGYQQEWCGVPVIRMPDDILVLQEIIWQTRPPFVVETGIARGGSLILSASLQSMAQLDCRVLGLDIQILEHARRAIRNSPFSEGIKTWQGDSASQEAAQVVADFITKTSTDDPGLLILDSDHSHKHVFNELCNLAPLLPKGSLVLVADTLIEEMPEGHYLDRPWGRGDNPLTAVRAFLGEDPRFALAERWCRRGLLTEFRNGILQRVLM